MAVLFSTTAFAQGTAADAKAMLERTVAAIKADKAKTLDQINRGENGFLVGDLYPFCFSLSDGIVVAIGIPQGFRLSFLIFWRSNIAAKTAQCRIESSGPGTDEIIAV